MKPKPNAIVSIATVSIFALLLLAAGGCATDSKVIAQAGTARDPFARRDHHPQLARYLQQVGIASSKPPAK